MLVGMPGDFRKERPIIRERKHGVGLHADDQIDRDRPIVSGESEGFAQEAFDSVANDRRPDASADADAQSGGLFGSGLKLT